MNNPKIKVRYRGRCHHCPATVQTTLTERKSSATPTIYIRCRSCGRITETRQDATEALHV